MAYCYEQGIPHSVFLSWDATDRAKVVAWAMEKAQRCPSCGTADWEWAEDRFAYSAVQMICHGCQVKEMARDDDSTERQAGVSVVLLPRAAAETVLAEQAELERRSQQRSRARMRAEAAPA